MLIQCKGYTFDLCFNGQHFLAINQANGHRKTRQCAEFWINDLGDRVTDTEFIACWEQGVRDWQALHNPAPRPRHRRPSFRTPIVPPQHEPLVRRNARGEGNRYE